jgi:Bacterial toxin homologue of phage lysozyme, C-term
MADTKKPKKAKASAPAYSGPALTEENLPAYDKAEIATERKLRQDVKDCAEAAKKAKTEIADLRNEQKDLDKKDPEYKKKSADIKNKIKALNGVATKKCKLVHPGCVPSDTSSKVSMPKEATDAINKKYGTKVDFDKLSAWEGGAFRKGYIPWWPHMDSKQNPTIQAMTDSAGVLGPRSKGDLSGKPKNKSGATVGIGVDIGQVNKADVYFKNLDSANKSSELLNDAELKALKEKIQPYFNKQGGEACKYLKDHPLELNEKETNLLNQAAHDDALSTAQRAYEFRAKKIEGATKKFTDLTVEQQTALISNGYQYGSPKPGMIDAIANGNKTLIPKGFRESTYLSNTMPDPVKKPPGGK